MTGGSFLYAPNDTHIGPSGYASMRFTVRRGALLLTELHVGSS